MPATTRKSKSGFAGKGKKTSKSAGARPHHVLKMKNGDAADIKSQLDQMTGEMATKIKSHFDRNKGKGKVPFRLAADMP